MKPGQGQQPVDLSPRETVDTERNKPLEQDQRPDPVITTTPIRPEQTPEVVDQNEDERPEQETQPNEPPAVDTPAPPAATTEPNKPEIEPEPKPDPDPEPESDPEPAKTAPEVVETTTPADPVDDQTPTQKTGTPSGVVLFLLIILPFVVLVVLIDFCLYRGAGSKRVWYLIKSRLPFLNRRG